MADSEVPTTDGSLLARIRHGSEGAAGELYRRYAQRLLALTQAKAGQDLQAREDVEDIVQSVFGSFFRGAKHGAYHAPDGEELWGLFLVIALNKIRAKGAFHRAAKRDVRRTVNEGQPTDDKPAFDPPGDDHAADLFLRLVVDEVLQGLPESHRAVARMRIEGCDVAEIATACGRSKRTVERLLQEFRTRMSEQTGAADDTGHGRTGGG